MSYDVDVAGEWFNITYNLSEFFRDFGAYPPDWDEKPRSEVGQVIDVALLKIGDRQLADLKIEYDSPNGWGKVEHAIDWLTRVREACYREMDDVVRVS